jgi:hypothetical protein
MKKFILNSCVLLATSAAVVLGVSSNAEAVNLRLFSNQPPNSSVSIPGIRCFFGVCRGGRFNNPVSFSFDSTWENDQNTDIIVDFSFDLIEEDTFSNDIFNKTFTFTLPADSFRRVPGFVSLSANELNSTIERAPGNISLEGRSLEFIYANPTFSFRPVSTPEPASALAILAFSTLGAASTIKRKQNQKSTEKETAKVG